MKTLVVLSSDLYVRNFLQTGAFSQFDDNDTFIVSSSDEMDGLAGRSDLGGMLYLRGISVGKRRVKFCRSVLFPYLTFSHSKDTTSFGFRARRLLHEGSRTKKMLARTLYSLSKVFGKSIVSTLARFHRDDTEINEILEDVEPDIVVIPSFVLDVLGMDFIRICKKKKIPTVSVINGWDNLSSKIVFPINPDYLCVWGEQSKSFAHRIHGMKMENVYEIGSPVISEYEKILVDMKNGKKFERHYDFEYVLFAGCSVAFDEISALRILDDAIEKNCWNFKIIYRPHPWRLPRLCADDFYEAKFKHVVIDKQIEASYRESKKSGTREPSDVLPSLDYYPSLLLNSMFMITPLSTMTLEALFLDKMVLSIAYDDGVHLTSPHNLINYEHFEGVDKLYGLFTCRYIDGFAWNFGNMVETLHKQTANETKFIADRAQLSHYVFHGDGKTYAERLKHAIETIHAIEIGKLHMTLASEF